jgi:hypothetical protein
MIWNQNLKWRYEVENKDYRYWDTLKSKLPNRLGLERMMAGTPWGSILFLSARGAVKLRWKTQLSSSAWIHGMASHRNTRLTVEKANSVVEGEENDWPTSLTRRQHHKALYSHHLLELFQIQVQNRGGKLTNLPQI